MHVPRELSRMGARAEVKATVICHGVETLSGAGHGDRSAGICELVLAGCIAGRRRLWIVFIDRGYERIGQTARARRGY